MKIWIIFALVISAGLFFYNKSSVKRKRTITSLESIPESIDRDPIYIQQRNPLDERL
ncbi:MAG: hypothetical protein ACO20H_10740 [Bacteriovoracaceae bacterium]